MNRRRFLVQLGGFALAPALALAPLLPGCATPRRVPADGEPSASSRATLEAVLAHLLPSEPDAPGAREIDAAGYFLALWRDHRLDAAERAFLARGLDDVERLAQANAGRRFADLDAAGRETLLRAFEQTADGGHWLGAMLGYLMEALLADPVYGGNPDGIGWRWLAHTPGFPRPPAHKRYFLL